jgi:hypothetical protein
MAIDATSAAIVAAVCRRFVLRIRIVIGEPFHAATGGEEWTEVFGRSSTGRTRRTTNRRDASWYADPVRDGRCASAYGDRGDPMIDARRDE